MTKSIVGIRECPQELDVAGLQAAAEAAYLAFQRNVRRTHDYLPEPAPFSEKEGYLRECYVEMCRAAFEAYAASGWQDISTAPKDGTEILVCGPAKSGGIYRDVQRWPKNWSAKWPVAYMAYAADEPTHWMRLPLPPESSGQNLADATPKPHPRQESGHG